MKQGSFYRMRAVLFETIADCGQLKESLLKEGISVAKVFFGLAEKEALLEAVYSLGVRPEECLFITNNSRHAEIAKHLSIVCIGCIEGLYELPQVNTLLESPDEVSPVYLNMLYCHEKGYPAVILQTKRCFLKELTAADGVYENESGKLIGKAGFKEGSSPLEVGYLLDSNVWGRGIATEVVSALVHYAKEELGITELAARIHHDNIASRRVAEKCGIKIEEK